MAVEHRQRSSPLVLDVLRLFTDVDNDDNARSRQYDCFTCSQITQLIRTEARRPLVLPAPA